MTGAGSQQKAVSAQTLRESWIHRITALAASQSHERENSGDRSAQCDRGGTGVPTACLVVVCREVSNPKGSARTEAPRPGPDETIGIDFQEGIWTLRQLGRLPKEVDPKVFADYLLTLGMKTRIDERPDGHSLWIYNEDHLGRAREELSGYLSKPDDPRYRSAVDSAKNIRREERQLEQKYRKNFREAADIWGYPSLHRRPVTIALVGICLFCFVLSQSRQNRHKVEHALRFSTVIVDSEGRFHNNGLKDIGQGEVWRLVTPIFLHFSIWHLVFNLSALSALGTMIELRRGSLRFGLMILVLAVVSNAGEYFYQERVNAGAPALFGGISGVVCGLFGYVWMKGLYEPEQGMILHPNSVSFGLLWVALCLTGVFGSIANAAHLVGLILGVGLGVLRY
jgi:GlpG protein